MPQSIQEDYEVDAEGYELGIPRPTEEEFRVHGYDWRPPPYWAGRRSSAAGGLGYRRTLVWQWHNPGGGLVPNNDGLSAAQDADTDAGTSAGTGMDADAGMSENNVDASSLVPGAKRATRARTERAAKRSRRQLEHELDAAAGSEPIKAGDADAAALRGLSAWGSDEHEAEMARIAASPFGRQVVGLAASYQALPLHERQKAMVFLVAQTNTAVGVGQATMCATYLKTAPAVAADGCGAAHGICPAGANKDKGTPGWVC